MAFAARAPSPNIRKSVLITVPRQLDKMRLKLPSVVGSVRYCQRVPKDVRHRRCVLLVGDPPIYDYRALLAV